MTGPSSFVYLNQLKALKEDIKALHKRLFGNMVVSIVAPYEQIGYWQCCQGRSLGLLRPPGEVRKIKNAS